MIEVKNLSKKFGDLWALQGTTWSAQDKRTLGLLGPNGAGKSTTMKIMTGLLCSTQGSVLIEGIDVFANPIAAKEKIGYLPEQPPVYEDLKVYSYLDFICGIRSQPGAKRKSKIDLVIEKMQLNEVVYKCIGQLSKGFRQRVGIAQALVFDPEILILDEPSAGLDPHQVFELRNLIKSLKSEHTIVLSTHVLSEVQQVCDDVVILDRGQIKAQGALDDILRQMQGHTAIVFNLNSIATEFVQKVENLPEVSSVQSDGRRVEVQLNSEVANINPYLEIAMATGCGIDSVEKSRAQLEDVFIEVTKG